MVKYETERTEFSVIARITPVEVERESVSSVWINGDRRAKADRYHDTWEIAHAHLLAESERHVASAHRTMDRVIGYLNNVKGMKKPAEVPDAP